MRRGRARPPALSREHDAASTAVAVPPFLLPLRSRRPPRLLSCSCHCSRLRACSGCCRRCCSSYRVCLPPVCHPRLRRWRRCRPGQHDSLATAAQSQLSHKHAGTRPLLLPTTEESCAVAASVARQVVLACGYVDSATAAAGTPQRLLPALGSRSLLSMQQRPAEPPARRERLRSTLPDAS